MLMRRRRRPQIKSVDGAPTLTAGIDRLYKADLPVPKNSILAVVEARSNKVDPAVITRVDLQQNTNNKSDSGCSEKRSS